jgi:hypothetical protein
MMHNEFIVGGIPIDMNFLQIIPRPSRIDIPITGISGEQLRFIYNYVRGSSSSVDIETQGKFPFTFHAEIDYSSQFNMHFLFFNIITKRPPDRRHPDFNATALSNFFYEHFENEYGNIGALRFKWKKEYIPDEQGTMHPSDNFTTYYKEKEKYKEKLIAAGIKKNIVEKEAKIYAAYHTWTGEKIAQVHNLSYVQVSERVDRIEGDIVEGVFFKDIPVKTGLFGRRRIILFDPTNL